MRNDFTVEAGDVAQLREVVKPPMARLSITKLVTETTEITAGNDGLTLGQIIDQELVQIAKQDGVAHEISLDIDQELWATMAPGYKAMDPKSIVSRPTKPRAN